MTNDQELIESLGGPSAVAKRLKFTMPGGAQRVQNWLSRGIPAQVKLDHPEIFLAKKKKAKASAA